MLKALMKKQLLEMNSFYFQSKRTGKRRSTVGVVLFMALWVALFVYIGVMFYFIADTLIEPIMLMGESWIYFCFISLIALALGTFGSVFNTYAALYMAKDNETLMAMPLKPWKIVVARITGVMLTGMIYVAVVLIPSVIVRVRYGGLTAANIIGMVVLFLDVMLAVVVLTCLLGWVVALIAAKIRGKSWLTALISLVFFFAYFYLINHSFDGLDSLLLNLGNIIPMIQEKLYPFYLLGSMAEGNVVAMLGATAVCVLAVALVGVVLSLTFVRLARRNNTASAGRSKAIRLDRMQAGSPYRALLLKEWKRFTSSATYMLNCSLSTVLMPVLAIVVIINRDHVTNYLMMLGMVSEAKEWILLILAAGLCAIAGMNLITAPSISLEGKSIWISQSLPVSTLQILLAKYRLHLLVTLPTSILSTIAILWCFRFAPLQIVMLCALVALDVSLMGFAGLALNLKLPNLKWTNETAPVKQSLSVMISLFGNWVIIALCGFVYYKLFNVIDPLPYLGCVAGVLLVVNLLLFAWIARRGVKIYQKL